MPHVQSVVVLSDRVTIVQNGATRTLLFADIPAQNNTAEKIETHANTWAATNVPLCQTRIHVFTVSPLRLTVGTWNLGAVIPENWWSE
jgi:hypothetical protein